MRVADEDSKRKYIRNPVKAFLRTAALPWEG
jgi:hypothetical protein